MCSVAGGSPEEKGERGTELFKHMHQIKSLLYPEKESSRNRRILLVKLEPHEENTRERDIWFLPTLFQYSKR